MLSDSRSDSAHQRLPIGDEPGALGKKRSKLDKTVGPSGEKRRHYRAIWISDIHLGTRGCNDRLLIDFLDHVDSDSLYLVGDIIDGWRMKKNHRRLADEEKILLAGAAQRDRPPGHETRQARLPGHLCPRQS